MLKAAFGVATAVVLAGSATLAEAQGPERDNDARSRQRGGPAAERTAPREVAPRREVAPPRARAEPSAPQKHERAAQERGRRAEEARREMQQRRAAERQRQEQRTGERRQMLEQQRAVERKRADDRQRAVEQRRAAERKRDDDRQRAVEHQRAAEKEKAAERQRVLEQRKAEPRPDQAERRAEKGDSPRTAKYEQVRAERAKLPVEQRVRLRKAFRPDRDRVTRVRFTARVGTRIPRSVRLFAVPAPVYAIFPYYRDYRYVVVEETVCIVDPVTYEIIDVLDERGVPDAGPQVAELSLTERETAIVLESIPANHPEAQLRLRLALGAEIPDGLMLYTFAPSVLDQVPKLRGFRFVATRDEIAIVEPRERDIALVLDR